MLEALRARVHALAGRVRRFERRELREFSRWIESTNNLLHLSVLVFVPLLIGLVTFVSNATRLVSFLLFPPLAAGTYTFFADPEGRFSSPRRFVVGITMGAVCGWIAYEVADVWGLVPPGEFQASAAAAALSLFLTGVSTWALDAEEPTAFSTALLILLIKGARLEYVVGIALSSALVATVFAVWRDRFYERRARYLYRSTRGDDHVLVPMHDGASHPEAAARFGAAIAGAHDAGKVVLLDLVGDQETARAERALIADHDTAVMAGARPGTRADGGDSRADGGDSRADGGDSRADGPRTDGGTARDSTETAETAGDADPEEVAVAEAATALEALADRIEDEAGVPCEVVVAVDSEWSPAVVGRTVTETGCDLVVAPYERSGDDGTDLERFVRGLFGLDVDVVAFRSGDGSTGWRRAMVAVRSTSAVSNAMVEFARRVTGTAGRISVCHCIASESGRRRAETMLADLVEAFPGEFETRVAQASIDGFLEANAPGYDVVFLGASTDRPAVSRLFSRPTFQRLGDLDTDVAIVHRARVR